ncbi:MAG TPA: YbbC/YhhH family protein [Flavobacterium sp.]|uniref:YbbC/YhhH family protein n=1 Tax=unclassified Flavobacterium TaxID=196869 RepID=UPI0025BF6137|nr:MULTISPECIES: YbbC/YhhH family protein [unclassified Flavobacterium]HRE77864.1 YbbC/YhhH family protein [Flavobacterium sp.]
MKNIILSLVLLSLFSCASKKQEDDLVEQRKKILLERFLNLEIKTILEESPELNIGSELILKDSTTAVQVAEAILFNKYGKKQIKKQKPYTIFFVQNSYWVIEGSSPKDKKGGVFFIILNAQNAKVLKLKHT